MFEDRRCPGKRAHSSRAADLSLRCFRRRVVRNDGEDRRLVGSRSLGPTLADALSVVPVSPSPATGEDGSRGSKKNTPSGFGADWSHCKRSRDPGIPAEWSRSTARYKPAATAIAELKAPLQCSCPWLGGRTRRRRFCRGRAADTAGSAHTETPPPTAARPTPQSDEP